MATRPNHSIAAQINSAQVAISNSLAEPSISKPMAEYGYPATRIKQGQKLYENALKAVNIHKSLLGEQEYKTSEVNKITKEAQAAYQALAKIARAIWVKDKSRLAALGLQGKMPQTTAGFIIAAYVLFDNAAKGDIVSSSNEAASELEAYGYTKTKIASERLKIEALDKMNQAQEAAKGEAQNASREQDKALKALNEWMAMFTKIAKVALRDKWEYLEKIGVLARSGKTKAQRGASRKASETRARKKLT